MAKTLNISGSVTPMAEAPHISKSMKELAKERLQEFMKEEMKLVKGVFKCFESPGGSVKVIVKKYPGTQPFEKSMLDGETYEIPLYVARHLNGTDVTAGALSDHTVKNVRIGTCSYPIHSFNWKDGEAPISVEGVERVPVPLLGVSKRVQRYGFQSLEFAGV
jgi:hypothetical protein